MNLNNISSPSEFQNLIDFWSSRKEKLFDVYCSKNAKPLYQYRALMLYFLMVRRLSYLHYVYFDYLKPNSVKFEAGGVFF